MATFNLRSFKMSSTYFDWHSYNIFRRCFLKNEVLSYIIHMSTLNHTIVELTTIALNPDQTIATCQRNISQHCWAQHVARVWPPCWAVLRHVGCCWLKFDHLQT